MSATKDPLGDAITVLKHIAISDPSARVDTEDAHNRVQTALGYLALVLEIMRSLAKDNYVQGVILKLGDYDRAELQEARKVVDATRSYIDDPKLELWESMRKSVENFDTWERATRFALEIVRELPCPQFSPHAAHDYEGAEGTIHCRGRQV